MSPIAEEIYTSVIQTLSPTDRFGHLSERDWQAVRTCIKIAFAELDDLILDRD